MRAPTRSGDAIGSSAFARTMRKRGWLLVAVAAAVVIVVMVATLWAAPWRAPPTVASVDLTASPGPALNQSETILLSASAADGNGADQTGNAVWSWAADPDSAVQLLPTSVPHRMAVRGIAAGPVTITAEAALGASHRAQSILLSVGAVRLTLGAPGAAPINEPFDVPVTAVTSPGGAPVTNYTGTVHLTSSDPSAVLPADIAFLPDDHGHRNLSVTFGTLGVQRLTATDTEALNVSGSVDLRADHRPQVGFTVQENSVDRRIVSFASTSTDPDGDALTSFTWQFGDGIGGTGAAVTHRYAVTGPYTVNLTVTDAWGLPASASQNVTVRPIAWFEPMPPQLIVTPDRPFVGSLDYMDLFAPDAPWQEAARQIQVFDIPGETIMYLTDAELTTIIHDLDRRGIALGIDAGPLIPTKVCGDGIEGFDGPTNAIRWAARIRDLGGTVRYMSMDEPFAGASLYEGPTACHWTAEETANGVRYFMDSVHLAFPDIVIGDIEPIGLDPDVSVYMNWVTAFRTVAGYDFPYLYLDIDWGRLDWPQVAKVLETFTRSRGIEFGIIYKGNWEDTPDANWIAAAEAHMARYEVEAGGRPDVAFFASWDDKPDHVLPETNASSFTHLIDYYFRNRTAVGLALGTPAANGTREVSGTLADAAGRALAEEAVQVSVVPRDGPGWLAEHTVTGMVPDGANDATVGIWVNNLCGCHVNADFVVYEARYVEGAETLNRVPNGDFSDGLSLWASYGDVTPVVEPSDLGTGQMLVSNTTPTQFTVLYSEHFSVTPLARYTLTFTARIPPSAAGSGYLLVEFAGDGVYKGRGMIRIGPGAHTFPAVTDLNGAFHVLLPPLPPYSFVVQATCAGDESFWPAMADIILAA